jgi:hypothetical protein
MRADAGKMARLFALLILFLLIVTTFIGGWITVTKIHAAAVSNAGLHVVGNTIENSSDQVFRPLGVDRGGSEYMCDSGSDNTVFDNGANPNAQGLTGAALDTAAENQALTGFESWDVNTVRIPLNEDCWLGINGYPAATYTSADYQQRIIDFVNLLTSHGFAVIVDLHWAAPGTQQANSQTPMPDADHTGAFWTSVANTFKSNSAVIFDLFNEPYTQSWSCWLNGSTGASQAPCNDVGFAAEGMQSMVNTIRATGATNILMAGGLAYSNDLSQWLQNEPNDPQHNLAASWHLYNFNACNNVICWNSNVAPVAAKVPVITGELGENDCASTFIDQAMNWDDQNGVGYLGWGWDTYNCSSYPALISDYNGTPTAFGQGLHDHLISLNQGAGGGGGSTPTPTPTNTPVPTNTPNPTPTPNPTGSIAIDAGGSGAGSFVADTNFSGGTADTHTATVDTSGVSNPAPEEVYQTERYGDFSYTIGGFTPGGSYTVRLHEAETYWTSTGQREFNVSINSTQVLSNFDIVAAAGGADKAVMEQFTENANSSGQFALQFSSVVNYAKIDGIEILPNGSGGGTPTPTPTPTNTPTPTPTPISGVACSVRYVNSNQWSNGFTGNITITNTGSTTINGWTLVFTFPDNQQIYQIWNANYTQQAEQVTLTSVSYNGTLAPGGTASPGFNASWSGSNANPTSFTLNGTPCSVS